MMDIKLDEGAFLPTRAHPTDAGLDLRSPESVYIEARQSVTIRTGVHIKLPPGTAGLLVSKSGLNVNHDLTTTGLIDYNYSGEIVVKIHNHGDAGYMIQRGDKISQLVVLDVRFEDVNVVDEIESVGRGSNGFGSSGR